ncbi:hypothetical protein niasHT_033925 [Heterodera trifolii]|uniref:Uncharacterized protein n=1 Tax=Heterodera trifolii TaxID=157864 RepID=A0ABD2I165_9BILA
MLLSPPLLFVLSLCSLCAFGHKTSNASDGPAMPELPKALQKLSNEERNCLFTIYTMSKLFENKKVQKTLAKQSCDSKDTSEPDIWKSREKSNGWCEVNLERIDSEYGPVIMHAHGSIASINGARLFVKSTSGGIWIAIYQPECLKKKDESKKSEEGVVSNTLDRVRRWVLLK